jgi:hypothetical protein
VGGLGIYSRSWVTCVHMLPKNGASDRWFKRYATEGKLAMLADLGSAKLGCSLGGFEAGRK